MERLLTRPAPKGEIITLAAFCPPERIADLGLDPAFHHFAQYDPIISNLDSLVEKAGAPDANVVLAISPDDTIIGFAILCHPDPEERWQRVGEGVMMELAVIEVARPWRGLGLATDLLSLAVDHPLAEEKILYMVGYSWTWDLSGMTAIKYRDMMIALFQKFDFQIFQTNEPNIMMRPENLFMARIGANVPEDERKRFKMVRFNLDI